jgi:hypothetical protein
MGGVWAQVRKVRLSAGLQAALQRVVMGRIRAVRMVCSFMEKKRKGYPEIREERRGF